MAPLPETLHQIYKSIECKCFLGLFPEINRAWITVDNQLCLWNYDSKEYAIWNDQDQIIVSVSLVPPKPNVFSDDVKYVLVLATPVEIVLLAVWFEGNTTQGELHLEPTHITLPAENVNMVKIVGTKTGRIFMGGDDGYLYEIDYQAEEGWFSKRARKISHANTLEYLFARWNKQSPLIDLAVDESRNVLYTLSARGTVEVYDLGEDGRGCKRIASADIIAAAEPLCPRLKATQPGKEVTAKSIAVIPASESKYLTLVVTTSNALRLYVATFDVMNDQPPADQRPHKLELMHIRFPPDPYHDFGKTDEAGNTATPVRAPVPNTPFSPATVVRRPSPVIPYAVETSYHSQGVDLLGHSIGDRDEVLALHHTLEKDVSQAGEIRPVFQEKATKSAVTGKIWAISEKPLSLFLEERARLAGVAASMPTSYERGPELALWCDEANRYPPRHELALQHVLPPRHFFLLTNNGLHTMIKNRPIDRLYRCLAQSMGHDTASLERFEQSYGSAETCAMYLILATAPKLRNFWGGSVDSTIARYAAVQFFSHPEQPQFETLAATYDTPGKLIRYEPAIRFSGKHLGFALYLARLLKPLWNRPVMTLDRIKQVELGDLKMMLLALQQFLDEHPDFAPIPDKLKGATGRRRGRARLPRDDSMEEEEAEPAYPKRNRSIQSVMASYVPGESEQSGAQKEERKALSKLHILLRRSIEMIEFLQIVLENRFIGVTSRLSQADQTLLLKARFGEMVTTQEGFELTRALIDALMSAYKEGKGDQASVEAISQKLRTSCPGIFREEDRILHRANELLFKAKLARNPREREELLAQALEFFGVVAADLAEDKMPQVCENFLYLRAYSAVLELALKCAQAIDSDNVALGWYTTHFPPLGEEMIIPPEDEANGGAGAYESRMVCYSYVLSAVAELFLGQAPAFRFIPYEDLERRPVDDADVIAAKRTELFRTALLSQDELFHHILYRWFVRSHPIDLSGLLLEMCIHLDSPYIEDFLKTTQSDLLPNYYIRKDQFEKAARACYEMAFSREGLALEQRIDYLSKAKTAAQSAPGRGDLLSLVTDALDIAQVQSKALQELDALPAARALTPEEKEKRVRGREELLHEGLLDVTTLFNSYVRPFGLWEAGLHVLKVSGHVDEALTKRFWKSIINEELYKMQATGLNLESLRAKILSLGQALERDENVFPVEWICGYLEEMMAKDLRQYVANDYGWVPRVMHEAGFNLPVLFEIYHNALIEENNPDWAEFASQAGRNVAKLEVLKVQRWIISEWMQDLNSARDTHRRLLIAAATSSGLEERMGDYIRATANLRSEEARKLSQAFVDLQALVRRLTYRM